MLEARAYAASDAVAGAQHRARLLLQDVAPDDSYPYYVNCSNYLTVSDCRPNFLGTGVNILTVRNCHNFTLIVSCPNGHGRSVCALMQASLAPLSQPTSSVHPLPSSLYLPMITSVVPIPSGICCCLDICSQLGILVSSPTPCTSIVYSRYI